METIPIQDPRKSKIIKGSLTDCGTSKFKINQPIPIAIRTKTNTNMD
jgi:hypothetical protein